jgi:hypothetical protein
MQDGSTPLHLAAQSGSLRCVDLLLQHCDAHKRDNVRCWLVPSAAARVH